MMHSLLLNKCWFGSILDVTESELERIANIVFSSIMYIYITLENQANLSTFLQNNSPLLSFSKELDFTTLWEKKKSISTFSQHTDSASLNPMLKSVSPFILFLPKSALPFSIIATNSS